MRVCFVVVIIRFKQSVQLWNQKRGNCVLITLALLLFSSAAHRSYLILEYKALL